MKYFTDFRDQGNPSNFSFKHCTQAHINIEAYICIHIYISYKSQKYEKISTLVLSTPFTHSGNKM